MAVLAVGVFVAGAAVAAAFNGAASQASVTLATPPVANVTADPSLPAGSPVPVFTFPVVPGFTAAPSAAATAPATTLPSRAPGPMVARRIRYERLGISLRIVEGDGIDAPADKAAHYPGTGWPGGGKNVFIYAHAQAGLFLPLWDAQVGDEVLLDLTDGSVARYVVTTIRPNVAWNALDYADPTKPERLTLETCTSYLANSPRFIVLADPVP